VIDKKVSPVFHTVVTGERRREKEEGRKDKAEGRGRKGEGGR
jgi:hypothetical protein